MFHFPSADAQKAILCLHFLNLPGIPAGCKSAVRADIGRLLKGDPHLPHFLNPAFKIHPPRVCLFYSSQQALRHRPKAHHIVEYEKRFQLVKPLYGAVQNICFTRSAPGMDYLFLHGHLHRFLQAGKIISSRPCFSHFHIRSVKPMDKLFVLFITQLISQFIVHVKSPW